MYKITKCNGMFVFTLLFVYLIVACECGNNSESTSQPNKSSSSKKVSTTNQIISKEKAIEIARDALKKELGGELDTSGKVSVRDGWVFDSTKWSVWYHPFASA